MLDGSEQKYSFRYSDDAGTATSSIKKISTSTDLLIQKYRYRNRLIQKPILLLEDWKCSRNSFLPCFIVLSFSPVQYIGNTTLCMLLLSANVVKIDIIYLKECVRPDCISGGCVVDPTADNEEEVGHIRPLATDLQDTTGLKGLSSSLVSRLAYKRKKLQYQYRSAGAFNHRNSTLNLSRLSTGTKWAPIIKNFYNVVKFKKKPFAGFF